MRNASSILVLANTNSYARNNLKVLMIKRHTKARFMANMYVFPGGVLEPSDGEAVVAAAPAEPTTQHQHRCSSISPSATLLGDAGGSSSSSGSPSSPSSFEEDPILLPFRRAAIRELWEETSVAISKDGSLVGRAAAPDYSRVGDITPFAHWQTPVHEKYRYDTWFFAHSVEGAAQSEAALAADMISCPKELADLRWVEPLEALEMHRNDADESFRVPPPTYLFLDWLSRFQRSEAFMNSISCYKHCPTRSVPCVLPVYDGPGGAGGKIRIPSRHVHLDDGVYPARLFNDMGAFMVGDAFMPPAGASGPKPSN